MAIQLRGGMIITIFNIRDLGLLAHWSVWMISKLGSLDVGIALSFLICCSTSTRHLHYFFFKERDQIVFCFHVSFKLTKLSLSLCMRKLKLT